MIPKPVTAKKRNQSGLLFVPREWQRGAAVRWLKRTHAWTGSIKDEDALGKWAQAEFSLQSEPRPPRGKGPGKGEKSDQKSAKRFLGRERSEAEKWELSFNHPNGRLTVEHGQAKQPESLGVS